MSEAENCNHQCGSCGADCGEREQNPKSFLEAPNSLSHIKKVIGVVSGKGGVGKSLVTSLLATSLQRQGLHTAILDADVTGPSIPKIFGVHEKAKGNDYGLFPAKTKTGIDIMSVNLLLEEEDAPVIWRGPIIASTVKQFWTDVIWENVDCMFVDMPPGTGDVPLSVFQSLPLDGIVIVTSPQELVSLIVAKAVNMATMMHIPILGIVENMSYVECPDCKTQIKVFGESHLEETANKYHLDVLGRIPLTPSIATACDAGKVEDLTEDWLADAVEKIFLLPAKKMKIAVPTEGYDIYQHFGKCQTFTIYETADQKILSQKTLDASESGHSALAGLLQENDIDLVICGGIGGGAMQALNAAGIQVLAGIAGDAEGAVEDYLVGELEAVPDVTCDHHHHGEEHEHGGSCGCGNGESACHCHGDE